MKKLSAWKMAYAVLLLWVATAIASQAQTFNLLVTFYGPNGDEPDGSLLQDVNGDLYGITYYGGTGGNGYGYGTVFEMTPAGKLTTVYNFCSLTNCADGEQPFGNMFLAADGSFYGTTVSGGAHGGGIIFKRSADGKRQRLYSFCSQENCTDGNDPRAGLVEATDGNFYGTTFVGGSNIFCGQPPTIGCGTVFKLSPQGAFTKLYDFCAQTNCGDGSFPEGSLIQATNGDVYGTTSAGGAYGYGTVFKLTTGGTLTTLYSFCAQSNCTDGTTPLAGVMQATDGNLYGTTVSGGDVQCFASGCGTVFRITPDGVLTTLHTFEAIDGFLPYAGLIQATDGNFYGTTKEGGAEQSGTLFEMTPNGTLTTLYNFCNDGLDCNDGGFPVAGLVQATNGIFYGTAEAGGSGNEGTAFSLSTGLGPFVAFMRGYGKVGRTIGILGQELTGTTAVSFNGIPASFTVKSDTLIEATVPAGATTGYVTVTTPSGTLTSNVPFRVIP